MCALSRICWLPCTHGTVLQRQRPRPGVGRCCLGCSAVVHNSTPCACICAGQGSAVSGVLEGHGAELRTGGCKKNKNKTKLSRVKWFVALALGTCRYYSATAATNHVRAMAGRTRALRPPVVAVRRIPCTTTLPRSNLPRTNPYSFPLGQGNRNHWPEVHLEGGWA